MFEIVIVDDEINNTNYLKAIIDREFPECSIIGIANTESEALELLTSTQPDLVLLDIQLNFTTGFDLLTKIKKFNFNLIFITAYDHLTLNTLKLVSLNYIFKPIDIQELKTTILKLIQSTPIIKDYEKWELFIENETTENKQIVLSENNKIINSNDIVLIQNNGINSILQLVTNDKFTNNNSMRTFEAMTSGLHFIKVNKHTLINMNKIEHYNLKTSMIMLKQSIQIPVSENYKSNVTTQLHGKILFN